MATVRIEPPRKHFQIYFRNRDEKVIHRSSGIPHSPDGDTQKEKEERARVNRRIAIAMANDLETAENGNSSIPYIKALYAAALDRAMGIYQQNGTKGISVRGYLESWLQLQTHLNESRRHYQGYITRFCEVLGDARATGPLFQLDRRDIRDFIGKELTRGLQASSINNKLCMLDTAFADAERRNLMLCNIIDEDDYLDEVKLKRKPFTKEHLAALHHRWQYLGKEDSEAGAVAREWLTASKLAALQGMRIGDATQQIRGNFDLSDGSSFVTWVPEKTAHLQRIVTLPLHSALHTDLLPMLNQPGETKLTPRLAAKGRPDLCTAFKNELIATGIDPEDYKLKNRVWPAYSFHSHKHFYVNALEKALVPQDRRKLLAAHTSDAAHEQYLHAWSRKDAEALRPDLEKVSLN